MRKYRLFSTICHAAPPVSLLAMVLVAWLLAAGANAAEIERPADAVEVFHCSFDQPWDANYDDWPDRWTRKSSTAYPNYVDIRTSKSDDPQATHGRYLEIDLDGASAAVSSPPIRVTSRFSYLLVARLYTSGLKNTSVTLSIGFYNSSGKLLESRKQVLKNRSDGWHTIAIESIEPDDESIDRAVIELDASRGSRGDLHGKVCLDDVWLARLPRIVISTNCPHNVYPNKEDVVVRCELSGIREQNPEIRFQLFDATSKELDGGSVQLDGRLIEEDTRKASDIVDGVGNAPKGYEGVTEWRPNIPGPGFYSVIVTMLSSDDSGKQSEADRKMDRREIWLAVVPPLPMAAEGEFGWTIPDGKCPLDYQELAGLLPNVGINWLKLPVWYDAGEAHRGDEIIRFVEMLSASNIDVVGVLDHPPAGTELANRLGGNASIADLFAYDPSLWLPSLDPVMSRLSMRLRYWQLGADGDTNFVGFANLPARIQELRTRLFRFGQEVKLGVPWLCDAANQIPRNATWDFEQLSPDPNMTVEEFEAFVAQPWMNKRMRWITIEPPQRSDDGRPISLAELDAHAEVLVRKIVAAKQHDVQGIFVSNPFNDKNGLMRENGMPAELLMPWRTCASMLSGAEYLGTVQLPGGSENRNFLRSDGQVVMVVWNAMPTLESLYLGKDVRQVDMWGHSVVPAMDGKRQIIEVGTLPTFVIGVSEPVTRWRMAMRFEHDRVESIFGVAHPNAIEFKNYFGQGVGGSISLVASHARSNHPEEDATATDVRALESDLWSIEPPQGTFSLSPAEIARFPFDIRLKNAIFGEQPVRVDFVVDADETYEFSVYRTMWVGAADLTIEMRSHLDKDGSLVVQQYMTNNSETPVDFKCSLRARGYRPQRAQVYRLGATPDRKVYRFPNGAALLGQQLLLEAEELGGQRVLKLLFIAKDEPPTKEEIAATAVTKTERSSHGPETN
jgi:hypothetical protein